MKLITKELQKKMESPGNELYVITPDLMQRFQLYLAGEKDQLSEEEIKFIDIKSAQLAEDMGYQTNNTQGEENERI